MNRMTFRGGQAGNMAIPGGAVGKARFALANGNADEAERILRKRLQQHGDDANARLVLAQALLQQRQVNEAVDEARRVLRDQPKNVDAMLMISAAQVQKGGIRGVPDEALTMAQRAVQLSPKNANARVQLAEVFAAKRNNNAARAEIEEACRLDPRSAGAQLMRALILLGDKDAPGAVQAADAALRFGRGTLAPASLAQAEFIKANALTETKRYDEALASLDAAERQNPLLAGTNMRSQRGRIYFKQRKYRQSYNEFLVAQRQSGRLVFLAPVLAALTMVLSPFGERAPYILVAILVTLAVLALLGISYIPVVGPWIVAVLVAAAVGFFAFAALRFAQGRIFPADPQARLLAFGGAVIVALAGTVFLLFIFHGIASLFGAKPDFVSPFTFGLAASLALALSAASALLVQRVTGRAA